MAETALLPEPTDATILEMVTDFKYRHRGGKVDVEAVRPFLKLCRKLAGDYSRFSCDNSAPTSVLDQMINALDKARAEERFIPWQYVFADYSVTGLDASRRGYASYKAILADKDHLIETTYIDDFTRASRSELEWWKSGTLSKRLGKRMIGASDGFDLSNPNSDILITVFGLVSRLFMRGLKEKVTRRNEGSRATWNLFGQVAAWLHTASTPRQERKGRLGT